jgi:hypothetical protein
MPNGARCRTAPGSILRQVPYYAKCQKAPAVKSAGSSSRCSAVRAVRLSALFGCPRRSAVRALRCSRPSAVRAFRLFAPFGCSRPSAVRALRLSAPFAVRAFRLFAPFGCPRPLAVRALRLSAPFGCLRRSGFARPQSNTRALDVLGERSRRTAASDRFTRAQTKMHSARSGLHVSRSVIHSVRSAIHSRGSRAHLARSRDSFPRPRRLLATDHLKNRSASAPLARPGIAAADDVAARRHARV